jgi:hypothetical protein
MLEDVNFPSPLADFGPLQYPVQSQSFHVGDILTISTEIFDGVRLSSVTNFCANSGTNSIKGWSATGCVDAEASLCDEICFNETLSISGLQYCGVSLWFSLGVNPCGDLDLLDPVGDPILELSGGGAFSGLLDLNLSGSFSLFPLDITGFSIAASLCDVINATIQFSDSFEFTGASASARTEIDTGLMQGSVFCSGTVVSGEGVTACILGGTLTYGTTSGGMTWAFSEQPEGFRLTSSTVRIGLKLAPSSFSVSVRFGRSGLAEAVVSLGLSF